MGSSGEFSREMVGVGGGVNIEYRGIKNMITATRKTSRVEGKWIRGVALGYSLLARRLREGVSGLWNGNELDVVW